LSVKESLVVGFSLSQQQLGDNSQEIQARSTLFPP